VVGPIRRDVLHYGDRDSLSIARFDTSLSGYEWGARKESVSARGSGFGDRRLIIELGPAAKDSRFVPGLFYAAATTPPHKAEAQVVPQKVVACSDPLASHSKTRVLYHPLITNISDLSERMNCFLTFTEGSPGRNDPMIEACPSEHVTDSTSAQSKPAQLNE
jgi:hypothetical protein